MGDSFPQIGLGWQFKILLYYQPSTPDFSGTGRDGLPLKFVLITGNEAVFTSIDRIIYWVAFMVDHSVSHLQVNTNAYITIFLLL